jgi:hypothetical protein
MTTEEEIKEGLKEECIEGCKDKIEADKLYDRLIRVPLGHTSRRSQQWAFLSALMVVSGLARTPRMKAKFDQILGMLSEEVTNDK